MTYGELMAKYNAERAAATQAQATPSMQAAIAPKSATAPAAEGAPSAAAPRGFPLPELDPNDPDFAEKEAVHKALLSLDEHFSKAVPNVDFMEQYGKIAEDAKNAPQRRDWNALSKFAVAVGTQGRDPSAPNVGLANMEAVAEREQAKESGEFEKVMGLKKAALEGHINQLMQQGKFRQALAQLAISQDMAISESRREHGFRMKEEEAKAKTRTEVANINAKAKIESATRRSQDAADRAIAMKMKKADELDYRNRAQASLAEYRRVIGFDPITGEARYPERVDSAYDEHMDRLRELHDEYEDKDGNGIPDKDEPAEGGEGEGEPASGRPAGSAWKAAAGR